MKVSHWFVAVTALAMSLVLPDRLRTAATARTPPAGTTPLDARLGAYTSGLIVGMALAEGPAILGAIFFLIEGHWLSLVAVGLGVLMMIWKLPTEAAIRDWLAAPAD